MKNDYIHKGRVNQKLETRDKILQSARFFLQKGKEFTLEDIAHKAEISRATVYRYYSNTEILSCEAVLDIKTKSAESMYMDLKGQELDKSLISVQHYYNDLALKYEDAFRKYLSVTISSNNSQVKRGARRKKTLKLLLNDSSLSSPEQEHVANFLTVLMGIEPLIVTKDVCGLTSQESVQLLSWGMEMFLKGLKATSSNFK